MGLRQDLDDLDAMSHCPKTNYEKVKSMTLSDMASFLGNQRNLCVDNFGFAGDCYRVHMDCVKCFEDILSQEVK